MSSPDPSSATIPSRPDPESNPLTRLPAELRNNIFTKAITEEQPIRLKFESTEDGSYTPTLAHPDKPLTGLALAKTCHQFRQEVLSTLCAVNPISLDLPTDKYLSEDAIPGYLSKTPHLIIHLDDFDKAGGRICDAARINIRQRAGRIVGWDVEGNLEGRCVCVLEDIMMEGEGKLCAKEFVVEFERRMVRVRHRWPLEVLRICKTCGRERTFTKWNACF